MYGKVTRCFHEKGFAFIYGDDGNSYFVHYSNLRGEYIERGYYVFFKPFQNDRSDFNAKDISVICTPDRELKKKTTDRKKKKCRKHKSCNADRVITDDKKFQRFVKNFMHEQKTLNQEWRSNGNTY